MHVFVQHLNYLLSKVLKFFIDRIGRQYPPPQKENDRFKRSKVLHENFFLSRAEFVIGRDDILKKVFILNKLIK